MITAAGCDIWSHFIFQQNHLYNFTGAGAYILKVTTARYWKASSDTGYWKETIKQCEAVAASRILLQLPQEWRRWIKCDRSWVCVPPNDVIFQFHAWSVFVWGFYHSASSSSVLSSFRLRALFWNKNCFHHCAPDKLKLNNITPLISAVTT